MISRAKKYVAVLLVFVCVCMIFSPQTAYAAEDSSQHETVKVGFFAMNGYHMMDEEGNRSGYGYNFLRLMARYWDVDYEYVGYDQSWDCLLYTSDVYKRQGYKKEYPWLKEIDSLVLANVQLNLEGAFRKFFREPGVGFPPVSYTHL